MAAISHPLIEIDVVEELVDAQHIWEQFTRDLVFHGAHLRLQRGVAFPRNIDEMIVHDQKLRLQAAHPMQQLS